MLKTRFDGTEETSMDKAFKLAGEKSEEAQKIIIDVLLSERECENSNMGRIDQLGLYDERIVLMFKACNSCIADFIDTIHNLYSKQVPQERILSMKTQQEFIDLVKEFQ